jgi:hypothetical protein
MKTEHKPGMVTHACNLSTPEEEREDLNFKTSLRYIARPYLKSKTRRGKK